MKLTSIIALIAVAFTGGSALADSGVPKTYPLKSCPVSGEEYGSGGMTPHKVTHEGTEVWLCCKSCEKKFAKDPAKYTQPVKDAAVKQ